ncbi:glycosyl hydrolase family 16 [Lentiprolixibacter aurantiacus]|uniref:Glycosyl hydrolase family 16 n=1 Tax=Lentiprolixibacter aurantiacus TaxID=2993939 RepID=A0AAE3SNN7_9FLAO|nr:glycosyl hydrolase family 16 [Lentiprolixibacter aurantiacus]MCX2719834.1 glycosyl hydrolase family 16 [Lentiprolixibacter aurantiacus]
MKNEKRIYSRLALFLSLIIVVGVGCERDFDFGDDAQFAKFGNNPDIFIDGFSAGLEYLPFAGSKFDAFSVDTDVKYSGEASMRFDVPNAFDPGTSLGFAGAIFPDYGGRDLTGYDALTFWAKASKAETISAIGFGNDFEQSPYRETGSKYLVTKFDLRISTGWTKYIIPIPDPSKLVDETGMFWYAEGPDANGDGYTFWIDELKFEKLGTIAQPQPAIFNGVDGTGVNLVGTERQISGTTQTFNLANGVNETVFAAPAYFDFTSSNTSVASVSEIGIISAIGEGVTEITATLAGVRANGSLELTVGEFSFAPTPPARDAEDVKSIFSDAYANATESNFTPGFGGSTTETTILTINGDNVATYFNNNFTGIIFDNTIDASALTTLHVDVFVQEAGTEVGLQIRDIGANQTIETDVNTGNPIGDDKDFRTTLTGLTPGEWTSFDIPLGGDIASQKDNLGALILVGGPNFTLDNIYFYR